MTAAPSTRSTTGRRAFAVAAAVVAAVVIRLVASVAGADLAAYQAGPAPTEVGVLLVVAAALVATLAGWALLAVLERFTARATSVWTVIAVVVTVLSLASPLFAGADLTSKLVLALIHVVVAVVFVTLMRRTSAAT